MKRTALTLTAFAALAAWASAQNPPTMSDELKALRANRELVSSLLDRGVKLSDNGGDPLARAEECRTTAAVLGDALKSEVANPSTPEDRVAELAEHLAAVVQDGLAPNIEEAAARITPDSPQFPRLKKVRDQARQDLDATQQAFPTTGKLGQSQTVADAKRKLADASKRITSPQ